MSAFQSNSRRRLLAVFHRPDFEVPARGALIRALLVAGLDWLNETEPHWLSAPRAGPKGKRLSWRIPKRFWHPRLKERDSDFMKANRFWTKAIGYGPADIG